MIITQKQFKRYIKAIGKDSYRLPPMDWASLYGKIFACGEILLEKKIETQKRASEYFKGLDIEAQSEFVRKAMQAQDY